VIASCINEVDSNACFLRSLSSSFNEGTLLCSGFIWGLFRDESTFINVFILLLIRVGKAQIRWKPNFSFLILFETLHLVLFLIADCSHHGRSLVLCGRRVRSTRDWRVNPEKTVCYLVRWFII
jgi:hypothetical protein